MSSQPTLNERVEFGERFLRLQGLLVDFIDYDSRTDRANRYFPTEEAARDWLEELLRRVESTLPGKAPLGHAA